MSSVIHSKSVLFARKGGTETLDSSEPAISIQHGTGKLFGVLLSHSSQTPLRQWRHMFLVACPQL